MKGLKLTFAARGASLDLSSLVEDFDCVVQNAMVCIATAAGSDAIYPGKGTNLLKQALSGAVVDVRSAGHASNFAAVDTLFFSRSNDYSDSTEKLAKAELQPVSMSQESLQLTAQFTSTAGKVVGITSALT